MKAAQLASDAILLPSNFEAYRHYSELFKEAVATLAPQIAKCQAPAFWKSQPDEHCGDLTEAFNGKRIVNYELND